MFTRILLAAIIAGILAGLFATAVQSARVIPLILEAERYENSADGGESHSHDTDANAAADGTGSNHDHDSNAQAWAPHDGFERTFFTAVTNIVIGVAFSLILLACVLVTGSELTLRSGLAWGLAGFVVFVVAPNFGLPPELPGMQAAGVFERQVWWVITVVLTAGGLALFAFKQKPVWMLLGVALILAPHIYGAPQPVSHESAVPANLAASFVMATLVASALFWLFLGGVAGFLYNRAKEKG